MHWRDLAGRLLLVLFFVQVVQFVWPTIWLTAIGGTFFFAYAVVALYHSSWLQRLVGVLVVGGAALLSARLGLWADFLGGVKAAILFGAFMVTMQLLRATVERAGLITTLREHLDGRSNEARHDFVLANAHFVSVALAAGALVVLAPIVSANTPAVLRQHTAESALQGVGLAVLWSPFFVAMAVATELVPSVNLGTVMASGGLMACAGLLLSHILYGSRGDWSVLRRASGPLLRMLLAVFVLAGAIAAAERIWHYSSLESVVLLVTPICCLVLLLGGARRLREGVRLGVRSLSNIAGEAVVVGCALILGKVLTGAMHVSGDFGFTGVQIPAVVAVALPSVVMVTSSMVGVHPIVTASVLLSTLGQISSLSALVVVGSVLLGWMLCVVLSVFVVPVMLAAAMFEVSPQALVRGRNMRFCLYFLGLGLSYLLLLNYLTR